MRKDDSKAPQNTGAEVRKALNAKTKWNSYHPELSDDSPMPIGKYIGDPIKDVPTDYLAHMAKVIRKDGKNLYTNNKSDRVREYYETHRRQP